MTCLMMTSRLRSMIRVWQAARQMIQPACLAGCGSAGRGSSSLRSGTTIAIALGGLCAARVEALSRAGLPAARARSRRVSAVLASDRAAVRSVTRKEWADGTVYEGT